jgi:phage terminase large subunit-like protein
MADDRLARWRQDPCTFIEQVLVNPETRKPFELLPAERVFIKYAFLIGDDGRLLYYEWVYSAPKKSGKTGFAALMLITTLFLFGGRYGEGFTLANDLEQSLGRVFEAVKRILASSPLLAGEVKIVADKITFNATGATITPLASDASSAAGGHPIISTFDELHGYVSERSRRLFEEMSPVPTRRISARLTVTYCGYSGESTLLEDLFKRGMEQPLIDPVNAPDLRAGDGILFFWSNVPIAPWQDAAWLAQMRKSLRPNQFARMILNQWISNEDAFISLDDWDACVDPLLRPTLADRALPIYVGIDASVKHDSSALVAATWDRVHQRVQLVAHKIFQPTPENPIDFTAEIEQTVLDWRGRFNLRVVYYDPYQMAASSQRLLREGIPMEEFPQSMPNLTAASQNLFEAVRDRNFVAYPNEAIRLAVSRAVAIESARGWRIGKALQSHKIDVVIALAQSALAATRASGNFYDSSYHAFTDNAEDVVDGATAWRNSRAPRPTWGPDALGARRLPMGGYAAPSFQEMWDLQAEERRREKEQS